MKTVIYARKSTMKLGQKDTIENQIKICKRRANELGLTVVDIKKDVGTGTSDNNRDEIKEMIADSIDGKYECVIMKGVSRFYRDVENGLSLVKKLDRSGIRVITVEENFDSFERRTANGQLDTSMLTMYLMFAESESKKFGDRIKHTQLEKAYAGEWNQAASPPYGYIYNRTTKKLEVHPTNSTVVNLIFDLYLNGMGMKSIAFYLNGDNPEGKVYPSSKGKKWSQYTIGFMLKNRAYAGDVVYNKRSKNSRPYKNPESIGKTEDDVYVGVDYNKSEEWVITENAHEAIIPRTKFNDVQKLIESKGIRTGIRNNTSLLASIAKCGKCGKGMTFKRGRLDSYGRISTRSNYYCSNYIKYGKTVCDSHHLHAEDLESFVIQDLKSHIKEYLNSDELSSGVKKKNTVVDKLNNRITKIETEINKLSIKTDALLDKNLSGIISDAQFAKMNEKYITEMDDLTKSLVNCKSEKINLESTDKINEFINRAYDDIVNIEDYPLEKQRLLLIDLIEKIVVIDGDITIEYKF